MNDSVLPFGPVAIEPMSRLFRLLARLRRK